MMSYSWLLYVTSGQLLSGGLMSGGLMSGRLISSGLMSGWLISVPITARSYRQPVDHK